MDALPRLPFDLITIITEYADPCTQARLAQTCRQLRDQIYSGQYGVDGPKLRYAGVIPGMITNGTNCVHPTNIPKCKTYILPDGSAICKVGGTAQMLRRGATTYWRKFYLYKAILVETWDCTGTIYASSSPEICTDIVDECKLMNAHWSECRDVKRTVDEDFETPSQKRIAQ